MEMKRLSDEEIDKMPETNPYPKTLIDECTGQVFEDDRHKAYEEGEIAGILENIREMIDWFERHWISKSTHEDGTFEFLMSDWQALKKKYLGEK